MRLFYLFLLRWAQFDLAIALDAPVPNKERIALCRADETRWLRALQDWEVQNV
jgi:hypothetical protein